MSAIPSAVSISPVINREPSTRAAQPIQQLIPMLMGGGMPTLPGYVFRLNQLFKGGDVDLAAAAWVIRTDASLTVQVLRLANLYLLESQAPIFSVAVALREIGPERLQTLLMTCPLLDCAGNPQQWGSMQTFWQHSYTTAVMAETIAEICGYPLPELAFTAGLVHNIGELPLMMLARNASAGIPLNSSGNHLPHYEIGRRMAIAWKLLASLVEVCGAHHHPETARHDPMLMGIVISAQRFTESCGLVLYGAPQQLSAHKGNRVLNEIFEHLPAMDSTQRRELEEILSGQFEAIMGGLEFNSSGLLKAASNAKAAEVAIFKSYEAEPVLSNVP
ncbi:MAG: metal dependent phosphohydrolase [Acidobacteriales bacterium]|nr:metal dependent phosphohydrolase [Terriglobales bacterium]